TKEPEKKTRGRKPKVKETKEPEKKTRGRKPKVKETKEPEKKTRGRKPKVKETKEPEKKTRGRKPKVKETKEPEKKTKRGRKSKIEFADLTARVYEIVIENGREGILQSELWKKLGLSSREGSRLAIKLEKRRIVDRQKLLEGGRWTYKLTPVKFPVKVDSIENIPCITCPEEERCAEDGVVTPFDCLFIENWVLTEQDKIKKE
ncbi:MAG: hypothetical protein MK227_03880, partial [Nitrososphaerales archaeon]|nr:hypothetical protein [Nitrososphaerales archaeon]